MASGARRSRWAPWPGSLRAAAARRAARKPRRRGRAGRSPKWNRPPEYSRRVVARIHNKIDITREELGEYLIARFGVDKLQFLINRRIIELACQEKGIVIGPAEIEASIDKDCAELGVDRRTFVHRC